MRILRLFIYLIVIFIVGVYGLGVYVDHKLESMDFSSAYNDCQKVWSTRGIYGDDVIQNSIESIRHAFNEGAKGVEVDVRYDFEMKDFIVSHDYPYKEKNGRLLHLGELFDALGDDHYFWLDFKNLRHLSKQQTAEAIQRLYDISQKNNLSERIYIEGEDPINISRYRQAGFHTIFDTHPLIDDSILSGVSITLYKIFFYFGDHTVMGMPYSKRTGTVIYGPKNRERLGNIPVFLYHVPVDEKLVAELIELPAVRATIVGVGQSLNLHYLDHCPGNNPQ